MKNEILRKLWNHALRLGLVAAALAGGSVAAAESLEALAVKAAKEGPIVWYEANSAEMGDRITSAFEKQFPNVKLRFLQIAGAQGITTRILQESEAKAPTADVTTTGIDQIHALGTRGLTDSIDWSQFGVPAKLTPQPLSVATTAAIWVIVYNTDKVSKTDAPKGWMDLLEPRWKGVLGLWAIGHSQANLAAAWGEQKTDSFVKQLLAQQPLLYKSNFTIAQHIASGEISVGITPLHVAQALAAKGAPIAIVAPEPSPMSMIYSAVIKGTPNPNGARLLVAWLSSRDGALAYEEATGRGNPFLPFTKTATFLKGREMSTFEPGDTDKLQTLIQRYTEQLRSGGAPK